MGNSEKISNEFYKKFGVKGLADLVRVYRAKGDLKLVKRFSKKSDKILDLACGYGRVTIPIAKAGYDITGIDLAPNLIAEARQLAKKQNLHIRFDVGSMTKLPYENESFDKVFCLWSSFNHLLTTQEQIKALNEIFRVLRTEGFAFLEMVNAERKGLKAKVEKEGRGSDKRIWGEIFGGVQATDYMHTRETMRIVCSQSKFKIFDVGFGNLHKRRRIIVKLYR